MAKDIGTTKDGRPILARACGEENSGVVFERDGKFVARFTYPVGEALRAGCEHLRPHEVTENDVVPVYEEVRATKPEAVQALKLYTGWADFERRGPGY